MNDLPELFRKIGSDELTDTERIQLTNLLGWVDGAVVVYEDYGTEVLKFIAESYRKLVPKGDTNERE